MLSGERGVEARLTMSGSLPRSDRARSRWKTDLTAIKHEEELSKRVLSRHEAWINQLTDESDQLKQCLLEFSAIVSSIVSKCSQIKV